MATVKVMNIKGESKGEVNLPDSLFGIEPNVSVMHFVVRAHLAAKRQGTQSAKTRAEVSGGGKKPWKQKGTGSARQGSTRSPQWKHGGIVFAPKPRDYTMSINKKVKRLALASALSSKLADDELVIVDKFDLKEAKTREMNTALTNLKANNALIVTVAGDTQTVRCARNLPKVETTAADNLSTYDILAHKKLVITEEALKKIEEVYA